jgi:folate-dependent phosphoribosylglycinamide formyltransferase PurN
LEGILVKVALFSVARGDKWALFASTYYRTLRERGIEIAVAVLDERVERKGNPLRHAWSVSNRKATVAGCSAPAMFARIVVHKLVTRMNGREYHIAPTPDEVTTVRVATLNSEEAVQAVRSRECDLVCLMGARIISKKTLGDLGVPVINIHSSDPRFVRGSVPVVWEILDRRDSITLTIHEAVEKVDAGAILREARQPICYAGTLGRTVARTMQAAKPKVAALLFEVILDYQAGRLRRTEFTPGALRVTPSVLETLRADWLCRRSGRMIRRVNG